MNKFYLTWVIIIIFFTAHGQTVTVTKQSARVKGDNTEGYSTELEGKSADVGSSWSKYIKEIGKTKLFSSDPVIISEPVFNGTTYSNGNIYANIFENGKSTRVWLGVKPSEWESNRAFIDKQLERIVYQFGIRYHKEKVQTQIDETQQALDAVVKQAQKLAYQNKELTIQQDNNNKEKVALEKSMEVNKLENAALIIKLSNNKKAQDSLANTSTQIKKVMEAHKARLRKIN